MHTFAIGGHAGATRELAKGGDSGDDATWTSAAPEKAQYSRNQVISWNKQSIYNFNLGYTQEAADIYISEMVESKVSLMDGENPMDKLRKNMILKTEDM